LRNFSGNIVFCRSKLPADLAERIDGAVGRSPKPDAAPSDARRMPMKPEFVG